MTKSNLFFKTLKRPKKHSNIPFLLILISLLMWKCISPPDYLGGDLLPEDDFSQVKTDTTFAISAYTQRFDTVYTFNFPEAVAGETWDPIFGKTQSSFLTQIRLGSLKKYYGTNPTIDSAYLFLSLSGQLGKEPMKFAVYELTDSIASDSLYNAISPIDNMYNPVSIGQTLVDYNGEENVLKIPINSTWVYDKLIAPTFVDSTIVETQVNFIKHMPGIYVAPITTLPAYGKGMYYFNYISPAAKMVVYYKNDEQEVDTVSLLYTYGFSEANERFNHFVHDTNAADPTLTAQFNYPNDPLTQDSVFYLKGLGLSRGVIVLDSIANWIKKMPVAIHKAELRFELEEHENMPKDTLAEQLFLYKLVDNQRAGLIDYLVNQSTFGGKYSKSKKYYSFNITHHLQSLLKEANPDLNLYLEQEKSYLRANGAVLRSGNHSNRIKLIITYTKL